MTPSPTIIAPAEAHTHTVVFLHGRGDTAPQFCDSLWLSTDSRNYTLREEFPSFRWVFPTAGIFPCRTAPGDQVSQWFDIWDVRDFSDHEHHQAEGLKPSVARIRNLLAEEAALLEGRWDRIILAGISQGAATATHTLLNLNIPKAATTTTTPPPPQGEVLPRRLAAYMGFSCRMPFPGRSLGDTRGVLGLADAPTDNEVLRNTPILLEHCVDDPLVLVEYGRTLRESLRGFGANVAWREYQRGGHWFNSPQGMDDVVSFLTSVLGASLRRG
ncbi:hypothetical protein JDV02_004969 [Purpureocillium takamizusanense]|uniref:Phospholipase/carboxylesterase/thioesterase domain-containing protein n=1 Tax=Purpureocillium takamizusanense TaxID=2060973 RepID=A0A9Q8QGC7_9HYPO|nr:uncharacterized protein JDV02_004969 [Purpureocillium takamizusanense]UNI18716.1 hypothetical protein JDV02_004969 [Purpureocillium takamizusanense]